MKISVIVPVYNVDLVLEKCIRSILLQKYKKTEIIIIDDGSTDSSAKICELFEYMNDNIIIIHKKNGGVSSARNIGLECASGNLITFVDSDDTVDSDMYEVLISYFEEDTDIVHCSYKRIQGGATINIGGSGEVLVQNNDKALESFLLGKRFTGSLWNKIFRASLLDSIRLSESLVINEDILFCFWLFYSARSSKFIDLCKYNYIVRNESATNTVNELRKITDSMYVCQCIYEALADNYLKRIAFNRWVACRLSYFQYLYKYNYSYSKKMLARKELLIIRSDFNMLSNRNKIVFLSLVYIPHIYCAVYSVYNKIRKPNWDVN